MNQFPPSNGDDALKMLREGNEQYRNQGPFHHSDQDRRLQLLNGQHPFAAVLSCSDSRVPPEVVFNRRLGDLFVIRNAGNVVDDVVLGSIEYAVIHLDVKLVVVLGHDKCGAVTATVQNSTVHGHLASIMSRIQPAVEKVKDNRGDTIAQAIDANILEMLAALRREPELRDRVLQQRLKIVGMRYNLDSGTLTEFE